MPRTPQQIDAIRSGVRNREAIHDSSQVRGLNRIEIQVRGTFAYEARNLSEPIGGMSIDEPEDRGGDGTGPTPLSHFFAGVGACLLNQFIRVSISEDYSIAFEKAHVRGEFGRNVGGRIERITTEVYGHGSLSSAEVDPLIARAEALCYVHNTLAPATAMTTILYMNGVEVGRRGTDRASADAS
jgi:uncharacterized OsmC-like protein